MCQACGNKEHIADGFLSFRPNSGMEIRATSVDELIQLGIGVSPYAVMVAFGSQEYAEEYVKKSGYVFSDSMLM